MIDTSHMPALPLLSWTIPGGNGFDDVSVLATDPLGYVQDQMDKRSVKPFDTTGEIVVADPNQKSIWGGADLSQPLKDWWNGEVGKLTANAQGLVIAVMLGLLGILFVAFGLYQITKD